jgi:ring-1,2-phenylacetyl-CoA epoxidase subunit PaaC
VSGSATDTADRVAYSLRLGDDALILAQRLSEWSSYGPELEEDIALTNIALDLLGQARFLLTHAAELEGRDRTEDDFAFLRDEREFYNCLMVEQSNGDFAQTILRQLLFSTYQLELYQQLMSSKDSELAAIAAKAVKEVAYHRDHAITWTLRLGDGTAESHDRAQAALGRLWPYVEEMFERDDLLERLIAAGIAADPSTIRPVWDEAVAAALRQSTLTAAPSGWLPSGGRRGLHSESFGHLLAEMQWLHRSHPGAAW